MSIVTSTKRHLPFAFVAAGLLACSAGARAGYPTGWTDAELALTPAYCQDVQTMRYGDAYSNTSPNAAKWVAQMGKGFWALHHYCWANINLIRADKPSVAPVDRQGMREGAIGDMEYVIHNTPPDFILLPEIYTRMGQVHLLLKHEPEAQASFAKARELKPDYWPAYFQWAQHLAAVGQKAQARKVLEDGLSYAPSSKTLRKLLVDLGGDPSKVKRRVAEPMHGPDKAASK